MRSIGTSVRSENGHFADGGMLFRRMVGGSAACAECGPAGREVELSDARWWKLPPEARRVDTPLVLAARVDPLSGFYWNVRALGQLVRGDVLSFVRPWDFDAVPAFMCARLPHYGVVEDVRGVSPPPEVVPQSSAVVRVRLVGVRLAARAVLDMAMSRER